MNNLEKLLASSSLIIFEIKIVITSIKTRLITLHLVITMINNIIFYLTLCLIQCYIEFNYSLSLILTHGQR